MTSTAKTTATPPITVTQFADGNGIDYADFATAFGEVDALINTVQERVSVSANDTHIKHLNDALGVGTGLAKAIGNPSADEILNLTLDSKLQALIAFLNGSGKLGVSGFDSAAATNGHVLTANGAGAVSFSAPGGGGAAPIDVTGTAGENLALRDAVYLETDFKWYKIDNDVTPIKCGEVRGIVNGGAITANATGSIRILGEVTGFAGLTAWADVYASATAGGVTQTKPSPTLAGAQVAVNPLGFATSTTAIMVRPRPIQYMKRASLADQATLNLQHHPDAQGRMRLARAYMSSTSVGSAVASYADTNQDTSVQLRNNGSNNTVTITGSGGSGFIGQSGGLTRWRAQSWQPVTTGTLTQFTFFLGANTGSPTGTLTWEIRADSAGLPNGSVLATGTLTPTASANNTVSVGSPPSLTSGTLYWLVLKPTSAQTNGNAWNWQISVSSTYASGSIANWDGSVWATASNDCESSYTVTSTVTAKDKLAQSFTIPATATIDSARLWLKKTGAPAGTLTCRIETNSAGSPSGTLANANATVTVAESTLGTSYGWIAFDFGTDFSLSSGTTYWLVLSTSRTASQTDYVEWGADGSTPGYANGEMKSEASSSYSAESKDACFEVIDVATTFDEPATVGRWSGGSRDFGVRFDDGIGGNANTQTTFKNVTGVTTDVTILLEMA